MIRAIIIFALAMLPHAIVASESSLPGIPTAGPTPPLSDLANDIVSKESGRRMSQAELQRQLDEAKLKADIAEANARCREAGGLQCGDGLDIRARAPAPGPSNLPPPAAFPGVPAMPGMMLEQAEEEVLPKVVMVSGDRAVVELPQGRVTVAVGDALPGGYRVTRIALHEVAVRRDREQFRLPMKWTTTTANGASEAK